MGLFSSKSSSSSTTSYADNSMNMSVDLSSGDLGAGAADNFVAGGDVYYAGLSEDLASQVFGTISKAFEKSLDWVSDAIGTNQKQTAEFVTSAVNSNAQQLQAAYNSEQATISSLKTYAFYAFMAWAFWVYFAGSKK